MAVRHLTDGLAANHVSDEQSPRIGWNALLDRSSTRTSGHATRFSTRLIRE